MINLPRCVISFNAPREFKTKKRVDLYGFWQKRKKKTKWRHFECFLSDRLLVIDTPHSHNEKKNY